MRTPPSPAPRVAAPSFWLDADVLLFRALGAGRGSSVTMRLAARWAQWSWCVLLGLVLWACALESLSWIAAAGLLLYAGLLQRISKRLARRWSAVRPFALGLCPNHLKHSGRAGFPSSHALVMGVITGGLLASDSATALSATALCVLVSTAWARVHTGAHFPSDVMVGAVAGIGLGQWLLAW